MSFPDRKIKTIDVPEPQTVPDTVPEKWPEEAPDDPQRETVPAEPEKVPA